MVTQQKTSVSFQAKVYVRLKLWLVVSEYYIYICKLTAQIPQKVLHKVHIASENHILQYKIIIKELKWRL